jgi:hypothetical protein
VTLVASKFEIPYQFITRLENWKSELFTGRLAFVMNFQ